MGDPGVELVGTWEFAGDYAIANDVGATYALSYNGTSVRVRYSEGPDRSEWDVLIDGEPIIEDDEPLVIDGYNIAIHDGVDIDISADVAGEHLLEIINTDRADEASAGTAIAIGETTVLPPPRSSDLLSILGLLFIVEVIGLGLLPCWAGRCSPVLPTG